ncbi:TPA: hypothetical protein ACX6RU_002085 [Photobacterium damselae]
MAQYNFIYKQLVESEDDIHGIISYSVYKRQKIQFISSFKEKNNGQDPTEADLKHFNEISMSTSQLEFYRNTATEMTQAFLVNVLEEDLKEREDYFTQQVKSLTALVKPSHLQDILKGALGSLVFVLLTGFLYFAVWSFSVSPKALIEQIFDVQIVSQSQQDTKLEEGKETEVNPETITP